MSLIHISHHPFARRSDRDGKPDDGTYLYFHHADLRAGYGHESGRGHETGEVHRFRKQDRPLRGGFHRQEKAENKITGCMKWKTEKLPG